MMTDPKTLDTVEVLRLLALAVEEDDYELAQTLRYRANDKISAGEDPSTPRRKDTVDVMLDGEWKPGGLVNHVHLVDGERSAYVVHADVPGGAWFDLDDVRLAPPTRESTPIRG